MNMFSDLHFSPPEKFQKLDKAEQPENYQKSPGNPPFSKGEL
jgi:hypothetical protein